MKPYFNLYAKIVHPINLYHAWWAAARGKRYHPAAAMFELNLEENLVQLEQELQDESYRPGLYQSFRIHKPKKRLVNAANAHSPKNLIFESWHLKLLEG